MEVCGGETVLKDGDAEIEISVFWIPGGESVRPHVVEAQIRKELQFGIEVFHQFFASHLRILLFGLLPVLTNSVP